MQRPSEDRYDARPPGEQQTHPPPPQPSPLPVQYAASSASTSRGNGPSSPTLALPPIHSLAARDAAPAPPPRYSREHDKPSPRRNSQGAAVQPPLFAAQDRDRYPYHPDARHEASPYHHSQRSPVASTFQHRSPVLSSIQNNYPPHPPSDHQMAQPPVSPKVYREYNPGPPPPPQQQQQQQPHYSPQGRPVSQHSDMSWTRENGVPPPRPAELAPPAPTPPRGRDPMALTSIMSGNDDPPPPPPLSSSSQQRLPPTDISRPSSKSSVAPILAIKEEQGQQMALAMVNAAPHHQPAPEDPFRPFVNGHSAPATTAAIEADGRRAREAAKQQMRPDERAVNDALQEIEQNMAATETANGFSLGDAKREYQKASQKRLLEVENAETSRRKRRRTAVVKRHHDLFDLVFAHARETFFSQFEQEAWKQVQAQEIADEKERKKDMQRKRRREKTLANESAKRQEVLERINATRDADERERLWKEAQKHDKKARQTHILLEGGTPSKDLGIREVTPLGPNFEGGMMGSFQMDDTPGKKDGRKGPRASNRPRKTKEQKDAEKASAAAAQAALDRGEDPPNISNKELERLGRLSHLKRDRSFSEDSSMISHHGGSGAEPYTSKAYNQIYEQIWREIAKKDVGKVYRIKQASTDTKASNLRKTAQLAGKEARRWQLRTNKSMKDVQARAKRSMREMVSFWKRNERDERDARKYAERTELENARKAEAEREANRQKRKLNFLISQTELYSHFIGKKVRTEDAEQGDPDVATSDQKIRPGSKDAHTVDLPDSLAKGPMPGKVTNFEDLDFDADDETALREAAMANAQNAVKEAQDRAREFDEPGAQLGMDDEGEMNFQNPSSLQNMDVAQPKMLTCQLKEYQLKGLNWLTNLYEQGINGILADEMGLGKTVQSISVMAYLAETHNIWGPFLVIAPASTLHNWVQEIAKFVPQMKVLPYWGTAKERKVLRKSWDRKHLTYKRNAEFHVMVTSYQLVVVDTPYFQKMKWQYMILDEAQAIKSSSSSRWKSLLNFHCRNRLLLTGTPIQNNMQELWALLHFIMPSLFDSHDEFSDWFSKDIESHAQSNTKLNEDQLKRLHMILKPFMLRRIKKHVQKELGDKIEEDVFCDLTYRQRAYYTNLRNKISIMDLIEKATVGDEQDTATLMNLVMQFRKVCNHPDLFERAETTSPFSFSYWAETASFMREGQNLQVPYSVRNCIEYSLPRRIAFGDGRLDLPGQDNTKAGWRGKYLDHMMNIWDPDNIRESEKENGAFSWLRFADVSVGEASASARKDAVRRAIDLRREDRQIAKFGVYNDEEDYTPAHAMFNIVARSDRRPLADITKDGRMKALLNISRDVPTNTGLSVVEPAAQPAATAPPIEFYASSQGALAEKQKTFFPIDIQQALYGISEKTEELIVQQRIPQPRWPVTNMLPAPDSARNRYTNISVPSMRRFVTDSGKLATLDALLRRLKEEGHRVLLYFQMTRMIDLMEEYLTYRNYKFVRLDGSTKLEDRRDTVADFQTRPEIFVFLLSTRAGGLGINLTSADTVIFYDSDWNPTIDSQAMDRAHRLGQTKQVTVYRLITRGTIEERIRKRALQKEEVQRVVITGQAGASQVEFGRQRDRENRTKDIAMWLADDEQAEQIERKEAEMAEREAREGAAGGKRRGKKAAAKNVTLDELYHEGEGHFADDSAKASGAATPISAADAPPVPGAKGKRGKGLSKKAKTIKQRLAVADGMVDGGMGM